MQRLSNRRVPVKNIFNSCVARCSLTNEYVAGAQDDSGMMTNPASGIIRLYPEIYG